jgi:hypothetical protein
MSEPCPEAAATPEARQTSSDDRTAARRHAVAVSPAIGPLPAIYVPLGPRRPSGTSPLRRSGQAGPHAGGVLVRYLAGRRRPSQPRNPGPAPHACDGPGCGKA